MGVGGKPPSPFFVLEAPVARKARSNASTIARFIAIDDDAIGGDLNTLGERYEKYLNSADLRHLELDKDKAPAYYLVRPFTSQERALLRDYFDSLQEEEGETKLNSLDAEDVVERFGVVRRTVLRNCVVGCTDHAILSPEIAEDGKLGVKHVRWDIGTPEPAGLKDAILEDELLVGVMLNFLFTISKLGEEEKN